jgi:D-psicose/D-tagatose/L-ribulose 3-epimerase
MVQDVLDFLKGVKSSQVGVCVDSAHVVLGSDGPGLYTTQAENFKKSGRLKYVHISAPDRGAVHQSWIPWETFLGPIHEWYKGPYLIEVFNAVPAFLNSLRLTRRKFWVPGEDTPVAGVPDAYTIADEAIKTVLKEFGALRGC